MLNKFAKTIEGFGPFENNPTFAVGVSGGIDSTALVLMLNQWATGLNRPLRKLAHGDAMHGRVIALTVNHNLRPESVAEAKQVKALLGQHGIEHHILDWEHGQISSNIHQKARLARLQLLTDWCKKHHVLHLCLAHIKDDLAETFLMNSLRGSGVYGLASITRSTVYNKIAIYRPLLDFTKEELKQYLVGRQVTWIEDPSNQNTKFFRTNVRNLLNSPDLAVNRLALSAKNLGRARHFMETECALTSARIVNIFPEGYLTIKLQEFSTLHEELALYLLSSCLTTISGKSHYKPRLDSLESCYKSILNSKPFTLWGCEIKTKGELIYVYREGRGYTVEQVDPRTWIWDNRFKIVAQDPRVISMITTYCSSFDSGASHLRSGRTGGVPKKIYHSLPAIILHDGTKKVPFVDNIEEHGIQVTFEPNKPLAKIKFDY